MRKLICWRKYIPGRIVVTFFLCVLLMFYTKGENDLLHSFVYETTAKIECENQEIILFDNEIDDTIKALVYVGFRIFQDENNVYNVFPNDVVEIRTKSNIVYDNKYDSMILHELSDCNYRLVLHGSNPVIPFLLMVLPME